ncbi:unnamed protein product [Paramecium primaurelia]|uniref:VPS9 domain-containing protein n=1 Tax=Paramecium primaurelia TaxID=5886 RepID=A0A8S1LFU9_PARPR|nr:unnamed protein product [Paramecium primaurelia]
MGNKNICCTQEEQQKQQQTVGSELKLFLSCSWYNRVNEIINKDYNHMPLLNEFRVQPTLKTIQQHLHIRKQMISDIFYSFVQNPKDLMFHSQMKISLVQKSIIITDNSQQSQLAWSFIKATDFHIDLKMEINQFIHFFADLIQKLYKAPQQIDEIQMLILDELFGNESFYDFVKLQYDKGLHSKIIAYRTNIQKIQKSQNKQEKAIAILSSMVNKRSPREKLQILDMAAQKLTQGKKNVDADKFNELVYDLIVQANIPSFVTEIKMIHHFAGEIDSMGRYGYILTTFMGVLMLIIQNY